MMEMAELPAGCLLALHEDASLPPSLPAFDHDGDDADAAEDDDTSIVHLTCTSERLLVC